MGGVGDLDDQALLDALLRSATMSTDVDHETPPKRRRREREKAPPEVMSIDEAADMLDIHYTTAKRLAVNGKLPGAFKIGAQWRVSRPALMRFLNEK